MSIVSSVDIVPVAMWPQGDIRDPLGVWGARIGVTGDASAGAIKVTFAVPESLRGAHVYTCYDVTFTQLTGAVGTAGIKTRLLTNFPDIDIVAGFQGFGSVYLNSITTDADFTAPLSGPIDVPGIIHPNQRFILLLTRQGTGLDLVEMEFGANIDLATFSFEGYGYYWDRSVLDAPGGPRHPGSS